MATRREGPRTPPPTSPERSASTGPSRASSPASVGRAAYIYFLGLSILVSGLMLANQGYATLVTDHGVFWTVGDMVWKGRLDEIFDPTIVTASHPYEVDPGWGLRPWFYPPTALPLVQAIALAPVWVSFVIWNIFSVVLYAAVLRRVFPRQGWALVILALVSWPVVNAINTGQLSLVLAAGVFGALALMRDRPVAAGIVFTLVGLIKPSFLVLLPIALVAGGHWRIIATGAVTTALAVGASILFYGLAPWFSWIDAVKDMFPLIVELEIHRSMVTPKALAALYELSPASSRAIRIAAVAFAAIACAVVFARTTALPARLVALVGGSFLAVSYAMHYDVAVLVPVAGFILLALRTWRDSLLIVPAFLILFPLIGLAAAFMTLGLSLLLLDLLTRRSSVLYTDP